MLPLNLLENALLELPLNLLALLVCRRLAVQGQEATKVELGLLQQLNLADVHLNHRDSRQQKVQSDLDFVASPPQNPRHIAPKYPYVLQGVDALSGLLNLAANDLGDQLVGELLQGASRCLALDDLGHLPPDGTDLRAGGVGGLLDLVGAALGESNGEKAKEVVVGGLDRDVGLDQGLPLADKRPQLVAGEVKTVEVGQAVLALDLVDPELDFAECVVLVLLEVGE